jgi:hypothetical protein
MERNFCSIQYNACQDPVGSNRSRSFTLSGNSNGQVSAMVGGGISSQPNSCPNDWLMIPCAKVAGKFQPHTYYLRHYKVYKISLKALDLLLLHPQNSHGICLSSSCKSLTSDENISKGKL